MAKNLVELLKEKDKNRFAAIDTVLPSSTIAESKADPEGVQPNPGENIIHWLGSSYSGADIKVIANLYTSTSKAEQLARLTKQRDEAEAIWTAAEAFVSGFTQMGLISADTVYDERKAVFLSICGLSNPKTESEQTAAKHMVQYVFVASSSPAMVQRMLAAAYEQASTFSARAKSLTQRLDELTKIEDYGRDSITLATLQTLSVQTYREKNAVRGLGQAYIKGHVRGPRTIAGTMIFTAFNEHALMRIIKAVGDARATAPETTLDTELATLIPDQLPPIDLTVVFANEYGNFSRMGIYGVEFVGDGVTMSIEDLLTEEVCSFVARDVDVMTKVGVMKLSRAERGIWSQDEGRTLSASDLMLSNKNDYQEYLQRLGVRTQYRGR